MSQLRPKLPASLYELDSKKAAAFFAKETR